MNNENQKPVENVSDADMLRYLVAEIGKTKDEIATEIRERFLSVDTFHTFLAKFDPAPNT